MATRPLFTEARTTMSSAPGKSTTAFNMRTLARRDRVKNDNSLNFQELFKSPEYRQDPLREKLIFPKTNIKVRATPKFSEPQAISSDPFLQTVNSSLHNHYLTFQDELDRSKYVKLDQTMAKLEFVPEDPLERREMAASSLEEDHDDLLEEKMDSFSWKSQEQNKNERDNEKRSLLQLCSPGYIPTDVKRTLGYKTPLPIIPPQQPTQFLVETGTFSFQYNAQEIEPIFCTLSLYDLKMRKKISGDYTFTPSSKKILMAMMGDNSQIHPLANPRRALFRIHQQDIHHEIYLVLQAFIIPVNDPEKCVLPYIKQKMGKKDREAHMLNLQRNAMTMTEFRVPFLVASLPIYGVKKADEPAFLGGALKSPVMTGPVKFKTLLLQKPDFSQDRLYSLLTEIRDNPTGLPKSRIVPGTFDVCIVPISNVPSEFHHTPPNTPLQPLMKRFATGNANMSTRALNSEYVIVDSRGDQIFDPPLPMVALQKAQIESQKRYRDELSSMGKTDGATSTSASPSSSGPSNQPKLFTFNELFSYVDSQRLVHEVPSFPINAPDDINTSYKNLLFVYPQELNISRAGAFKTVKNARNVLMTVELRESDEPGSTLECIQGNLTKETLVEKVFTHLDFHNKNPFFLTEIQVNLPAQLTEQHHLFFEFHHINCVSKKKGKGDLTDHFLGSAWFPIFKNSQVLNCPPDGISIVKGRPEPGYLTIDRTLLDQIDQDRPCFTFNLDLQSTLHTQDANLASFFDLAKPLLKPQFAPSKEVSGSNSPLVRSKSIAGTPLPTSMIHSAANSVMPEFNNHLEPTPVVDFQHTKAFNALFECDVSTIIRNLPVIFDIIARAFSLSKQAQSPALSAIMKLISLIEKKSKSKHKRHPILAHFVHHSFLLSSATFSFPTHLTHQLMVQFNLYKSIKETPADQNPLRHAWFFLDLLQRSLLLRKYARSVSSVLPEPSSVWLLFPGTKPPRQLYVPPSGILITAKDPLILGNHRDSFHEYLIKMTTVYLDCIRVAIIRQYKYAKLANRYYALFLKELFASLKPGFVISLIQYYLEDITIPEEALPPQKAGDEVTPERDRYLLHELHAFKNDFLALIVSHANFWRFSVPIIDTIPKSLHLNEYLCKKHFLSSLSVTTALSYLSEPNHHSRNIGLMNLLNTLIRIDHLEYIETPKLKKRVAGTFFPLVIQMVDQMDTHVIQAWYPIAPPQEKRALFYCFLWVISNMEISVLRSWISKEMPSRLILLCNLLDLIIDTLVADPTFQFVPPKETLMLSKPKIEESSQSSSSGNVTSRLSTSMLRTGTMRMKKRNVTNLRKEAAHLATARGRPSTGIFPDPPASGRKSSLAMSPDLSLGAKSLGDSPVPSIDLSRTSMESPRPSSPGNVGPSLDLSRISSDFSGGASTKVVPDSGSSHIDYRTGDVLPSVMSAEGQGVYLGHNRAGLVPGPAGLVPEKKKSIPHIDTPQEKRQRDFFETHIVTRAQTIISEILIEILHAHYASLSSNPPRPLFEHIFHVFVHLLQTKQTITLFKRVFSIFRWFIYRFRAVLFDSTRTSFLEELMHILLDHANSPVTEIRAEASQLLFFTIFHNYEQTSNFSRLNVAGAVALSKTLETFDDDGTMLTKSLKTIELYAMSEFGKLPHLFSLTEVSLIPPNIYPSRGIYIKSKFTHNVQGLCRRMLKALSDTLTVSQIANPLEDPVAHSDLLASIADGYTHTPTLRVEWLTKLSNFHESVSNFSEGAQCMILVAAMGAEFLKEHSEHETLHQIDMETFKTVSPSLSISGTDLGMTNADEGLGAVFSETNFITWTERAIQFLQQCEAFEWSNELYKMLLPIYERRNDFDKLRTAHKSLGEIFDSINKDQEEIRSGEKGRQARFAFYYRVKFVGDCFHAAESNPEGFVAATAAPTAPPPPPPPVLTLPDFGSPSKPDVVVTPPSADEVTDETKVTADQIPSFLKDPFSGYSDSPPASPATKRKVAKQHATREAAELDALLGNLDELGGTSGTSTSGLEDMSMLDLSPSDEPVAEDSTSSELDLPNVSIDLTTDEGKEADDAVDDILSGLDDVGANSESTPAPAPAPPLILGSSGAPPPPPPNIGASGAFPPPAPFLPGQANDDRDEIFTSEYIYKEPGMTHLFQYSQDLPKLWSSKLGMPVEVIKSSGEIDFSTLDANKGYLQITQVKPHFAQDDTVNRNTIFEESVHLTTFFFEKPFIKETPYSESFKTRVLAEKPKFSAREKEMYQQLKTFKETMVLSVEAPFPSIKKRHKVTQTSLDVAEPIQVATELIRSQTAQIYHKTRIATAATLNQLSGILSGSIIPQVQAGVRPIASLFLANPIWFDIGFVRELQAEFREFMKACREGLDVHENLRTRDELSLQHAMEEGYLSLWEFLAPCLGEEQIELAASRRRYREQIKQRIEHAIQQQHKHRVSQRKHDSMLSVASSSTTHSIGTSGTSGSFGSSNSDQRRSVSSALQPIPTLQPMPPPGFYAPQLEAAVFETNEDENIEQQRQLSINAQHLVALPSDLHPAAEIDMLLMDSGLKSAYDIFSMPETLDSTLFQHTFVNQPEVLKLSGLTIVDPNYTANNDSSESTSLDDDLRKAAAAYIQLLVTKVAVKL